MRLRCVRGGFSQRNNHREQGPPSEEGDLSPTFLQITEISSVHYAVLLPRVDTCVARVLSRTDHGFREEEVTRDMHASFASTEIESRSVIDAEPDIPVVADEVLRRFEVGMLAYPTVGA